MIPVAIAAALIAAGSMGLSNILGNRKAKKAATIKSKEARRETLLEGVDNARARRSEFEASGLKSRSKLGKNKAKSMMDTAAYFREGLDV